MYVCFFNLSVPGKIKVIFRFHFLSIFMARCKQQFSKQFLLMLCVFSRQFNAVLQDLMEALKLAPNNRELHRLLVRVKDECREQSACGLESMGSLTSINEIGSLSTPPDVVPTNFDSKPTASVQERRQEETGL